MRIERGLFLALLLGAAPLTAKPAKPAVPPPPPPIPVGQVIDDGLGKTISGWLYAQGSLYHKRETKGEVTTEAYECCIALFSRGKHYTVARTEALAKTPTGGVTRERVTQTFRLTVRPGEIEMECWLYSLNVALSLKNPATGMVRSVIVDNETIALLEWKDSDGRCSSGD